MKLGLLGTNIEHSLSPTIHNSALEAIGINGSFTLLPTETNELEERLVSSFQTGYQGLNVTAPHKARVLSCVHSQSDLVTTINSANTLVRNEQGWHAESTDGEGVRYALTKWSNRLIPGYAVILGSGGFARAVAFELLTTGWNVSIYSRRILTTDWSGLISLFSENLSFDGWDDRTHLPETVSLVVNATPLGIDGVSSPLPLEGEYHTGLFYLDAVYSPQRTPLLECLVKNSVSAQNGMRILVGQAARSFQLWTGIEFPENIKQKLVVDE